MEAVWTAAIQSSTNLIHDPHSRPPCTGTSYVTFNNLRKRKCPVIVRSAELTPGSSQPPAPRHKSFSSPLETRRSWKHPSHDVHQRDKFMESRKKCESCVYHLWFSFCRSQMRRVFEAEWAMRENEVCVCVCPVCEGKQMLSFPSTWAWVFFCFLLFMLSSGCGPQTSPPHKY